jgi:hypothetical protein
MKRKFCIKSLRDLSELDDCCIRSSTSLSRLCPRLATRIMSAVRMMAIRPNRRRALRLRLASNGLPRTIRTAIRGRPAHIPHRILFGSTYHRDKPHTSYPAKMADSAPPDVSPFHWTFQKPLTGNKFAHRGALGAVRVADRRIAGRPK